MRDNYVDNYSYQNSRWAEKYNEAMSPIFVTQTVIKCVFIIMIFKLFMF
jgi:hypothetical protein